ncbi:MAG: GNAT family N-acetyltransferase [Lachnospiraceae bacterium]
MSVREIRANELYALLELYLHLHESKIPDNTEYLERTWQTITEDKNHHIFVAEENGQLVSSCVCVIIPNLTRGVRPYAFVENVVTHKDYRNRGFATAVLEKAKQTAIDCNCYKMMLLTGAKDAETLRFYQKAGYNSGDKTAFIQWL